MNGEIRISGAVPDAADGLTLLQEFDIESRLEHGVQGCKPGATRADDDDFLPGETIAALIAQTIAVYYICFHADSRTLQPEDMVG